MASEVSNGALVGEALDEIEQLLYHEANLFDEGRLQEWYELLAEDITYTVPTRMTRERNDDGYAISDEMMLFAEDHGTLGLRVARLGTDYAWAEDPPTRTRHLITNVMARPAEAAGEVAVRSNFLIYRTRGNLATAELFAGRRDDRWRRTDDGWRLARRVAVLDQVNIGSPSMSILI